MATISMKKEFVIKDEKVYKELMTNIEKAENRKETRSNKEESALLRGEKKLKQFSFR